MTRVNLELPAVVSPTRSGTAGPAASAAKGVFSGLIGEKLSVRPDANQSQSNAGNDSTPQKCCAAPQNAAENEGALPDDAKNLPIKTKDSELVLNQDLPAMAEMFAAAIMQEAVEQPWKAVPDVQCFKDGALATTDGEEENPPAFTPVHSGSFFKHTGMAPDGLGFVDSHGFGRTHATDMSAQEKEAPENGNETASVLKEEASENGAEKINITKEGVSEKIVVTDTEKGFSLESKDAQSYSKNDILQTAGSQNDQRLQEHFKVAPEQASPQGSLQNSTAWATPKMTPDSTVPAEGGHDVANEMGEDEAKVHANIKAAGGGLGSPDGVRSGASSSEPLKTVTEEREKSDEVDLASEQVSVEGAAVKKAVSGKAGSAASGQRAAATMNARAKAANRFAALAHQMEAKASQGTATMQGKAASGSPEATQEAEVLDAARAGTAERQSLNEAARARESETDILFGAKIESAQSHLSTAAATQTAALRQTAQARNIERVERLQELIARLDEHVLDLSRGGSKSMTLQLTPPNLGRVSLSCHEEAGSLRVEISVENESVRQMLQQQERHLRDALEHGGYRLAQFDVRADGQGLRHEGQRRQASAPRRPQRAAAVEVDAPKEAEPAVAQGMLGKETVWYIA